MSVGAEEITFWRMKTSREIKDKDVRAYLENIFEEEVHAKRVLSIANASLGVIKATSLSISAIGNGLALANGLNVKHAIKQVDRLLSNDGFDVWEIFSKWVPSLIGPRKEILVALDWTDFDADDHSTLMLQLITDHGRSTPLCWTTVQKSKLKGWRNIHEDTLLEQFAKIVPTGVKVTILADRGFGDVGLYEWLTKLGFSYVIRFRGKVEVEDAETGEVRMAADWVPSNGRIRVLPGALVTAKRIKVGAVVCVKARKMKEPWCLATSEADLAGPMVVKQYGRRFTIEERFRESKDLRFGFGLSSVHIASIERRDRLLLLDAFAGALLTLLGAAGESLGMDRMLKANTDKRRTHSLMRQGIMYFQALPNMKQEKLEPLIARYYELLAQQDVFRGAFAIL